MFVLHVVAYIALIITSVLVSISTAVKIFEDIESRTHRRSLTRTLLSSADAEDRNAERIDDNDSTIKTVLLALLGLSENHGALTYAQSEVIEGELNRRAAQLDDSRDYICSGHL